MKRLYLSIIFVVIGSLLLVSWGLDQLVANNTEVFESQEVVLYKKLIEGFQRQLNTLPKEEISQALQAVALDYQVQVNLEKSENIALPKALESQLSQQGGLLLASESASYLMRKISEHPNFIIQLHIPVAPVEDKSLDFFLTIALYMSVCTILILWLLPLTRRLYLLNTAAAKIGEGHFNVRIAKSRFSYITMFENSFNRMAGQIEKLMSDNKILARSLSHDIRTPMACLRFGVEAAIDTSDVEKKNKYLLRMDDEITRMEEMTSAFLEYAGLERQAFHLKLQTVNINKIIESICHDCQPLAEQNKISLTCHFDESISECEIDIHWCYRAIQNLVNNATQYAKTQVKLSVNNLNNAVEVIVEDDGKGIPEDKLNVIFEPFIKLDADRSRENGHFGLGLAITAKVIDWHEATIQAYKSPKLLGACFSLQFPIKSRIKRKNS